MKPRSVRIEAQRLLQLQGYFKGADGESEPFYQEMEHGVRVKNSSVSVVGSSARVHSSIPGVLTGHPKPAIRGHLKTGHREESRGTLTPAGGTIASAGMSNVLSDENRQSILALGRLGWTLRRIEQATGVRRETAANYLKAAGIGVRPPGGWGHRGPAKPAIEVTTDSGSSTPDSKPAIQSS